MVIYTVRGPRLKHSSLEPGSNLYAKQGVFCTKLGSKEWLRVSYCASQLEILLGTTVLVVSIGRGFGGAQKGCLAQKLPSQKNATPNF